jgi:hypothetical protein
MLYKPFVVAALLAASCGAQAASDADLAAIRSQIAEMKQSYEQRIAALEQKLSQAEARSAANPPAATTAAADAKPVATASASSSASAFNPEVSLVLQGQYNQMKNVPNRTITGFWPTEDGTNQRGFSVNETELMFAANIDPYWRGQATLSVQGDSVEVEEAWVRTLGIGEGIGLKAGRFKSGIGYLNDQHAHTWDFSNAPLMYNVLFGPSASYVEDGLQFKWLAPTPLFVEFGAEVGRGASYPGSDNNKNGSGAGALYAHVGDDVGVSSSWRAGVSYLKTSANDRQADFVDVNGMPAQGMFNGDTDTWIADFVWKWAPNGNPKYQNFKFQSEYFVRKDNGNLTCMDTAGVGNACATPVTGDYDTRQSGWYAQGVFQFTPEWRAGLRYDQLDSGRQNLGSNIANLALPDYKPQRATVMVDYSWSEFSRARLQYAQDKSMQGVTDNQLTLQYIMSLGAHGAHTF